MVQRKKSKNYKTAGCNFYGVFTVRLPYKEWPFPKLSCIVFKEVSLLNLVSRVFRGSGNASASRSKGSNTTSTAPLYNIVFANGQALAVEYFPMDPATLFLRAARKMS